MSVEPHAVSLVTHILSQKQSSSSSENEPADAAVDLNPSHVFSHNLRLLVLKGNPDDHEDVGNDQEDRICDFEFSLAFEGKILLHNTNLRLFPREEIRNHGQGKNGVGKTTLMTNIDSGNIDGLPPSLRTTIPLSPDLSILDELVEPSSWTGPSTSTAGSVDNVGRGT
jgi:hypothetical protein